MESTLATNPLLRPHGLNVKKSFSKGVLEGELKRLPGDPLLERLKDNVLVRRGPIRSFHCCPFGLPFLAVEFSTEYRRQTSEYFTSEESPSRPYSAP